MRELTAGKTRGLQQLSNPGGIFTVCSVDHRRSLRKLINSASPSEVTSQQMMDFKADVCETLASISGSVLLDPICGAGRSTLAEKTRRQSGLMISLDSASYDHYVGEELLDEIFIDRDVNKVRDMGGIAVKIPMYYRPDLPHIASKKMETLNSIAFNCAKADMTLCVNPRNYIVPELERSQWDWAKKKPDLAIESARQLSLLPVDLLEVEFPADMNFEQNEQTLQYLCRHLDEASRVPWVLLSDGVSFEVFRKQLQIACKAGASGFVAGRALWQDIAGISKRSDRVKQLKRIAADRLTDLIEIAGQYATPWHNKIKAANQCLLPDFAARSVASSV